MSTITASALPISAIPVERFVERLYAPLAWEATVRLGDPAIASRLVERVLLRAWAERERFATFEALNRHVQDAALSAIAAEADRRREVTRFDDTTADGPVPGSLESMSVESVRRRIGEGRAPKPTPPEVVAVMQAAAAPSPSAERPLQKPRLSMAAARVSSPAASPPPASAPHTRKTASHSVFPTSNAAPIGLNATQKRAGGAAVVAVALVGVVAFFARESGDPQGRALAALADSAGPSYEAERGTIEEVTLLDSSVARVGAEGSLSTNTAFGDGLRAVRLTGPVVLALKQDSTALVAIQVGEHRLLTAGGVAAFNTDAAGRVSVQVDSGDVLLIRDSSRVRIAQGSVVRLGSGTPLLLSREERNESFGWRTGRLQLAGASLRAIAASARRWYDVEVRFPADRAQSDTASVDVPLASRDSLVRALEQSLRARADVAGDRVVLQSVPSGASDRRARATAPVSRINAPPRIDLPSIP